MKMKKYILPFMYIGLLIISSCNEEDPITYNLTDEGINFYIEKPKTLTPYPDELVISINLGVSDKGENLEDTVLQLAVETQGFTSGYDRSVALKVGDIEYGKTPVVTFPTFELAGEKIRDTLDVIINRATVERDTATVFYIQFDHRKMQLKPGVTERSKYKIRVTDYVNMELVQMTPYLWDYQDMLTQSSYSGKTMFGYNTGYGPWSNTKARFIMTVTGVSDFSKLLRPLEMNMTTWYPEKTAQFIEVSEALKAYKINSEADPVKYPPYYDETASKPDTWITFWDNYVEF